MITIKISCDWHHRIFSGYPSFLITKKNILKIKNKGGNYDTHEKIIYAIAVNR